MSWNRECRHHRDCDWEYIHDVALGHTARFLPEPEVRERFVAVVSRAARLHRVDLLGALLLPNGHAFIIRCPEQSRSRFMQFVKTNFSQWLNTRYGNDTPNYNQRYQDRKILDREALVARLAWMRLAPYRLGLCDRPDDWFDVTTALARRVVPDTSLAAAVDAAASELESSLRRSMKRRVLRRRVQALGSLDFGSRVPFRFDPDGDDPALDRNRFCDSADEELAEEYAAFRSADLSDAYHDSLESWREEDPTPFPPDTTPPGWWTPRPAVPLSPQALANMSDGPRWELPPAWR